MPGNAPGVHPSGAARGLVGPAYRTPSTVGTPSYSILRAEVLSHAEYSMSYDTIPHRAALCRETIKAHRSGTAVGNNGGGIKVLRAA